MGPMLSGSHNKRRVAPQIAHWHNWKANREAGCNASKVGEFAKNCNLLQMARAAVIAGLGLSLSAAEITTTLDVVPPSKYGGNSYTYMSVLNPEALNLDGSIYGIAVCLSKSSKANWTFSADGGGWVREDVAPSVCIIKLYFSALKPLLCCMWPLPCSATTKRNATLARPRPWDPTRRGRGRPPTWGATPQLR
jgi:hypothetical protein